MESGDEPEGYFAEFLLRLGSEFVIDVFLLLDVFLFAIEIVATILRGLERTKSFY